MATFTSKIKSSHYYFEKEWASSYSSNDSHLLWYGGQNIILDRNQKITHKIVLTDILQNFLYNRFGKYKINDYNTTIIFYDNRDFVEYELLDD